MVSAAEERIRIMIDCVDIGSFSAPFLHDDLIAALCVKLEDKRIPVEMLVTEEPAPISRASPFYGRSLATLKKDESFCRTLENYLKCHEEFRSAPLNCDADFIAILQEQQQRSLDLLLHAGNGAKIYRVGGSPITRCDNFGDSLERPLVAPAAEDVVRTFFWVRDDEEAIFLFSSHGTSEQPMSFWTYSRQLVNKFVRYSRAIGLSTNSHGVA